METAATSKMQKGLHFAVFRTAMPRRCYHNKTRSQQAVEDFTWKIFIRGVSSDSKPFFDTRLTRTFPFRYHYRYQVVQRLKLAQSKTQTFLSLQHHCSPGCSNNTSWPTSRNRCRSIDATGPVWCTVKLEKRIL